MDDREKRERDEHAEHGVPHPPPHEEEAMGLPNSDRLRSEVPQRGDTDGAGDGKETP